MKGYDNPQEEQFPSAPPPYQWDQPTVGAPPIGPQSSQMFETQQEPKMVPRAQSEIHINNLTNESDAIELLQQRARCCCCGFTCPIRVFWIFITAMFIIIPTLMIILPIWLLHGRI